MTTKKPRTRPSLDLLVNTASENAAAEEVEAEQPAGGQSGRTVATQPAASPEQPAPVASVPERPRSTPSDEAQAPSRDVGVLPSSRESGSSTGEPSRPSHESPNAEPADRRREPQPQQPTSAEQARAQVEEMFLSAKTDRSDWRGASYAVRLTPDLNRRLLRRLVYDRYKTGVTELAATHYLNAALLTAPSDLEHVLNMSRVYRRAMGMQRLDAKGRSIKARKDVHQHMLRIRDILDMAGQPGQLGYYQAAIISSFLDTLDDESPIPDNFQR